MSAADRLTDEEREALANAADERAWAMQSERVSDEVLAHADETFWAAVERILAARGVRAPGDTTADRDALAEAVRQALASIGHFKVAQRALMDLGVSHADAGRVLADVQDAHVANVSRALAARPAPDTLAAHVQALNGESLIAAERRRQVEEEGYTPEHDDAHGWQVLHHAAMRYLREECYDWPWDAQTFKPTDVVRDTIKAGALAQAAVEVAERAGLASYEYGAARSVRAQCVRMLDSMLDGVRALLAGRADASPEGGEQRG